MVPWTQIVNNGMGKIEAGVKLFLKNKYFKLCCAMPNTHTLRYLITADNDPFKFKTLIVFATSPEKRFYP